MVPKHRDDMQRVVKRISGLSGTTFSEGGFALSFIVEGKYRCIFIASTCDGDDMNSSPIGIFRW